MSNDIVVKKHRKRIPHAVVIAVALCCAFAVADYAYVDHAEALFFIPILIGIGVGLIVGYLVSESLDDGAINPNIEDTEEAIHHSYMENRLNEINNLYTRSIAEDRNYRNLYDNTYLSLIRFVENQVPEVLEYDTWDEAITHMEAFMTYDDICRSILLCIMGSVGYSDSLILSYLAEADDKGFCDLYQNGDPINFNNYGIALINNTYLGTYLGDYYLNFVVLDTGESITVDGTTYTASEGVPRVVTFNSADLDAIMMGEGELENFTISSVSSASDVYINGVRVDYPLHLFSTDDEPVLDTFLLVNWSSLNYGISDGTDKYIHFERTTGDDFEIANHNVFGIDNKCLYLNDNVADIGWLNLTDVFSYVSSIHLSFEIDFLHGGGSNPINIVFYNNSVACLYLRFEDITSYYSDNIQYSDAVGVFHDLEATAPETATKYWFNITHVTGNTMNYTLNDVTNAVYFYSEDSSYNSSTWTTFDSIKITGCTVTEFLYFDDIIIKANVNSADSYNYFTRLEDNDNITLDYDTQVDLCVTDILDGRADYIYFNEWHDSFNIIYDGMYDAGYTLWSLFKGLGYNSSSEVPSNLTVPYPDWLMSNLQALMGINQSELSFLYYNLLAQMNETLLWISENIQGSSFNITNHFADYMINATLKRANDSIVFDNCTVWMSVLKENMLLEKGETYTLTQQVLFYDLLNHNFYMGYVGDNLTIWNITYEGEEIDNYTMEITTLDIFASATYGVDVDNTFQSDLSYLMSLLLSDNMLIVYGGLILIAIGVFTGIKSKKDNGMRTLSKLLIVVGIILCLIGLLVPLLESVWDTLFGWWPF